MLAADLTPLQKLYNKGVDIAAGVIISTISAGIVAAIATIFWNWKKKRDLKFEADKLRQQHSIVAEEAEKVRLQAARNRRERLAAEMETFARAAEPATTITEVAECWSRYETWLQRNDLNLLPRNLAIINQHPDWARVMRDSETHGGGMQPWHKTQLAAVVQIIRNTELPPDA